MKRTEQMPLRVSLEEKEQIVANAKAAGLSTGDYLRARALGPEATPEVAATVHALSNTIDGLEDALATARSFLGPQKG